MQRREMTIMKSTYTVLTTVACAATLFLTGCATGRPPRQVGGGREPVEPRERPETRTSARPMPPTFEPEDTGIEETPITLEPVPTRPVPEPRTYEPKSGTPYTLKKGETLSAVAAKHQMNWKTLAEYNLIEQPDQVREGQVILLPPSASDPASRSGDEGSERPAREGAKTHTVRSGDNLSAIAVRYGTSVKALKNANDLTGDKILVGQILTLPTGAEETDGEEESQGADRERERPDPRPTPVATRPIPPRPRDEPVEDEDPVEDMEPGEVDEAESGLNIIDKPYPIIVREGDTLQSIADNYIVTVEEIRKLNNLREGEELEPGQELLMPATLY